MSESLAGWFFVVCVVLMTGGAMAEGDCISPPNETCDGAVVFTNGDLPYSVTAPLGCINFMIDKPYFDVFYRFDCTCTGDYTLDMCDTIGDMFLRIYINGCGWWDGDEFAVADDECPGSPPNADPMLTVRLTAGESYWIELGPWRPDPPWAPPLNSPYTFRMTQCACVAPLLTSHPGDLSVCAGGEATFAVAVEGSPPLQYQWRKDGVEIPGAITDGLVIPHVEPGDAGAYDVVVTDDCDTVVSNMAALEVFDTADIDQSGAIDLFDFAAFLDCTVGPGGQTSEACACADSDLDGDVDFHDFRALQRLFSGS